MSLQVWLPLNGENNIIPDISSFNKESNITLTEDTNDWYKVIDSSHTSSRWGVYYDFTVKPGMTYTLQVYSKSTTGIPCSIGIQSFQGGIAWPAVRDTNSTSTEKLTKYTWTTSQNDNKARIYLAMNPSSTIANNYVFYKQPRVYEAIHNQGIANVTITNNGATYNSAGKLGGCYKTSSSASINLGYNGNQVNSGSISFGGWFKFNQSEISSAISGKSYTSTATSATGNLIGNHSYGGVSLQWTSNNMYSSGSFSSISVQSRLRTSTNGDRATSSFSLPFDTWIHIFLTYDKSKNLLGLWINGKLKYTYTCVAFTDAVSRNLVLNYDAVAGGNGPSAKIPFLINDIRIYNNALSAQQIKKISQGLVLHYPLSDKWIESTTNLITTEDCLSSTCFNGAINKYGYGTNTDMYKTVTTFDGKKGTKVYMGTNGNNCYPYVYISNMFTSDGTNSPAYKTLSFDYYTTISTSITPYKLGSGNGTATYIVTNKNGRKTGMGTNSVGIPIVPNTWNHIEITFHGTTAADSQWGYIQNQPTHISDTSNFWFFANMQLEVKDHATGYAGVGGIRNSNIIYDCSGFCNNGTISGTLTISNDAPRYEISTYIPAVATITHNRCLDNINQEWSCAAWVKPKVAGNYQNLNNFNQSNRLYHGTYPLLYINSGTNDYYNYGNLALPANQWSHIVFVFKNSTGTKLIYINGENHTNMGGPNKTSTPAGIPDSVIIGGGNYEGGLCDYREYATALSAEDVLSLYNNEAYIDQLNEIHGKVR